VEQLSRTAENQLVQYDNLLTVDDVEKGSKYFVKPVDIILMGFLLLSFTQVCLYILHMISSQ
jgi:hypothetical protein